LSSKLKSAKKDWRRDEEPEFEIIEAPQGFLEKIASVFQKKKTEVLLIDPQGQESLTEVAIQDDKIKISQLDKRGFRPGLYKLTIKITEDGEEFIQTQEFTWGVLAINTSKSIYLPNEQAYLQIAALRNDGHTICDANLELEIISPNGSITYPEIQQSGECRGDNVTDKPDYFAFYQVNRSGIYQMKLSNLDKGYEIIDSFEVRKQVPFDIERIGPTRIYPPEPYPITFSIVSNQDFEGVVEEKVPASFEISQPVYSQKYNSVNVEGNTKIIKWQVSLTVGEQIQLGYYFDAPDISPYVYLLGPLKIGNFQEIRLWQIASDATTKVILTNVVLTQYTIPSDFSASNTIHVIGGGGGGHTDINNKGSGGGGGGAYAATSSVEVILPDDIVGMSVSATSTADANGTNTWFCKSTSNCTSYTDTDVIVSAKGGLGSTDPNGVAGGDTSGVGGVEYSGGAGGTGSGTGDTGGGGGGAGGPYGNGASGGNGEVAVGGGGGGGGGNGGGSIGAAGSGGVGGDGGNNIGGTGHGTGGNGASGTAGSDGGGGGGGDASFNGGKGGSGIEWITAGSGGGGGGTGDDGVAGFGGLYGGGGGGAKTGGEGAQGVIVILYTPDSAPNTPSTSSPASAPTATSTTPVFRMTATDVDSNIPNSDLSYRVVIYDDASCSSIVQFIDQAVDNPQTGWQGQNSTCVNTATNECYNTGTQGVYKLQTPLTGGTNYWWKAAAQDPDYSKTFTTTTCSSFATEGATNAAPEISWLTGLHDGDNITIPEWAPGAGNNYYQASTTFSVQDDNGWEDISTTTLFVYRSGVANCSSSDDANINNCYPSTSTSAWNPTDGTGDVCDLSYHNGDDIAYFWCTTTIYYCAEATDDSSVPDYSGQIWVAYASTSDLSGEHGLLVGTGDGDVEIATNLAMEVDPTSINYSSLVGDLLPGTNTGNNWATTTATTTGNRIIDIHFSGGDLTSAGQTRIPAYWQKFTTTTGLSWTDAAAVQLPTSSDWGAEYGGRTHDLDMIKPTTVSPGAASADKILWGIGIPSGQAAATYTSSTDLTATSTVFDDS